MSRTHAALLAAAFAAASFAAAAPAQEAGDAPIPLEEWRAMTAGKTLSYEIDGAFWGREYYHADRDVATFVTRDGDCVTAPWVYAEGLYCFSYRGMECFRHIRRDGRIFVAPLSGGAEQEVRRIEVAPLSCEPPLSS
ncbi:MAG: hypothetical protein ACFCUS_01035 [Rubrimonas sp.]|uniref:hypothetical protein n=1 Tax=Rubrimonas sp. TaxID=2036015 RepID=UPI002FDE8D9F